MSFASSKKQPKSFRNQYKTASKKVSSHIPGSIENNLKSGPARGNSLVKINPYNATANAIKTTSKPAFRTGRGSSSLVRPKRITYGMHTDGDLAPIDHTAAKQKLETLFVNKGVKKRDPLQLLTKPKKKLNLLKRLPNDGKYNPRSKTGSDAIMFSKGSIKLNSTGMNHLKSSNDSTMTMQTAARTATAHSQSTAARCDTSKGRTRKQIIAEFFCSQNWRYMSKKVLMVKNEREQMQECIAKYRRVKRGIRKLCQVYKTWIAKVKIQRAEAERQKQLEEAQLETEKLEDSQDFEEEKVEFSENRPETPQKPLEVEPEEPPKSQYVLTVDDDIFSVNDGLDLNTFKKSQENSTHEYDQNLLHAKSLNRTK